MKLLREIMNDPATGQLSWGRCASTFALLAATVWITRIVWHSHSLPGLDGITAFIIGPYGANKVGTALQGIASKKDTASKQDT